MKGRGLLAAGCLAALVWPGLAGAVVPDGPQRSGGAAPPSYRGSWYGPTAQGEEVSFNTCRARLSAAPAAMSTSSAATS
jgi:hypothetical protein